MAAKVLRLGVVVDLEALHCQPSTNVIRYSTLEFTTATAIRPNRC